MQKQPLKIFQSCCLFLKAGGIESLLIRWYKTANPQQISMDFGVSCSDNADYDFISYVQKCGNCFLLGKGPYWLLQKISYLINLYKLLKKNKYDVFQFHGGGGTVLFLENWVARFAGVKRTYLLIHGSPVTKNFLKVWIRRWNLKHIHAHFLAVSERAGENFYGRRIPFTVVHPGIAVSAFAYQESVRKQMREKLGLQHNFVVGHVGRFSTEKNHFFLLEIFQELYKQDPSVRLVLVGEGPTEKLVRQKAKQLQLEEKILFVGTQKEVSVYYHAFDVFILPSSYEGFGLVALEAQANGLPCFVADTISQQAQICNTVSLSLNKSPALWAKEILIKRNEFVRQDCSSRVKEAGFDITTFFDKMEHLYLQHMD